MTEEASEEERWVDTYAVHFPPKPARGSPFARGVGNEGYDRQTGVEVPKHPRLKRPRDAHPAADPFGETDD